MVKVQIKDTHNAAARTYSKTGRIKYLLGFNTLFFYGQSANKRSERIFYISQEMEIEKSPILETERLLLNRLKPHDIEDIVRYASNERISVFTQNLPYPYSDSDAIHWLDMAYKGMERGTELILAIRSTLEARLIGGISLTINQRSSRAEMRYWIGEPFWNKGYTTEAAKAMIKYGFESLELNRIPSSHFSENLVSGEVMKKNGMTKEGELKGHIFKNSEYHDLIIYGLNRDDFNDRNNSLP